MHFACWITKATHTLRTSNTYCLSTATLVTRMRLTMLRYTYIACLVTTEADLTQLNLLIQGGSNMTGTICV
jgi:hypothetical protein